MNIYLIIIIFILFIEYFLNTIVDFLNIKSASVDLPAEFKDIYDSNRYKISQNYLRENTYFEIFKDTVFLILTLAFILIGGFNFVDELVRKVFSSVIFRGLFFFVIIMLCVQLINIPFSIYHTFVIEEKYNFNRTTPKTFILDILKSWLLTAIIGGCILLCLIWFFDNIGKIAWLYCWIIITIFELFFIFVAPILILPLFNKFIPLEEGELKNAIKDYVRTQNFSLKGIFKIDASRRSTKSNAYFIGFGRFRRIALFDTLIQQHTTEQLLTILAHEVGHYKKKHFLKNLLISILNTGLLLFIFSLFIENEELFRAFRMQETSIYASFILFSFLYSPINFLLSIFANAISRKHEYEADIFAIETTKRPEAFISALKKLSIDNLSNLTPHRLKVLLNYSHPPILERIKLIKKFYSK